MKVGKIKKLKSGKYKIEIDGNELTTYSDVILNNDLLYKKDIDVALVNQINQDTKYYDTYNKIVKLILNRLRSEKEIEEYMEKIETVDLDKVRIIADLKRTNLLNDQVFASSYVNDHFYLAKDGPYKIHNDLLKHDIPETIINECLAKIPKEDILNKIKKLISKRVNKTSLKIFKQKMMGELLLLGFNQDMITECLNEVTSNDDETFKKEYDKVYKHLSKKYSGQELLYKTKQKMYQKGYDVSKIKE